MSNANVLAFRPSSLPATVAQGEEGRVLARVKEAFFALPKRAMETSPHSPGGRGPAFGPYGMPIVYRKDGSVNHVAGVHIDLMRSGRQYTQNAVELRCDALGLAIYVSGITQVDESGLDRVRAGVRVVTYDFRSVQPTSRMVVGTAEELHDRLRVTLLSTYNRLARQFNIAGLSREDLTLRSSHECFPDIPIYPEDH